MLAVLREVLKRRKPSGERSGFSSVDVKELWEGRVAGWREGRRFRAHVRTLQGSRPVLAHGAVCMVHRCHEMYIKERQPLSCCLLWEEMDFLNQRTVLCPPRIQVGDALLNDGLGLSGNGLLVLRSQ